MLICYKRNFNFIASLCSWGDWFETHFVGNPEDRFCRDEGQDPDQLENQATKKEASTVHLPGR